MLNTLIRWSLDNRPLVLALTAGLLVWGGYSMTQLPVDVLPDLTAPTVTVVVDNPGMAPTDMEYLVTFPIETAVNGAPRRPAGSLGDGSRSDHHLGRVRLGGGRLSRPADGNRTPECSGGVLAARDQPAAAGTDLLGHG